MIREHGGGGSALNRLLLFHALCSPISPKLIVQYSPKTPYYGKSVITIKVQYPPRN